MPRQIGRALVGWGAAWVGVLAISAVAIGAELPGEDDATAAQHWAYRPLVKPEVPHASAAPPDTTPIDHFIIDALDRNGLRLCPPADRRALIRRATFDLTGLPPTWDEVEVFLLDESPGAFAKVVDRLLASPRYGERWGRHWLDIARYADTHGGGALGAKKFPFAYTYRDYVIRAFNDDVPYHRFVREQLAADQLGLEDHAPQLAALGFLTVGRRFPNRHDLIDDRIDVVTRGLLGLTVTCARCHDHKYDAISTQDYYALYAVLASSHQPEDLPVLGEPAESDAYHAYQLELARRQLALDDMRREQCEVMRGRLRMEVGTYLREIAKGTPEQDLSAVFLSYRTDDLRPLVLERWRKYLAEQMSANDPVFGVWHRLAKLPEAEFAAQSARILQSLREENGDPSKNSPLHSLSAEPPRWNPRVLDALQSRPLRSMFDVADAYGQLFAAVHEAWLQALISTSREARSDTAIVPDEDPRHEDANSPVNRQLRRHLYGPETPTALPDELAATLLNRPIRDRLGGLRAAIHDLHLTSPGAPPHAMVLEESRTPGVFHVLRRGNPIDRGAPATPRFLGAITQPDAKPFRDGRRRLALADAIVDPANPLARRVVVNWVWQRHFGLGLVRSPDDFGTRGEPPTHPELLDYLAATFLEEGWSLKRLHRRILLSAVYRQGGSENAEARQKDPQNRLLWRMPRRRLEMEAMRDAMLFVANRLDTTMGGRPYDLFAQPSIPRRTVYGFVDRDVIPGFFSTFDMADPSACTAQRPQTTVPQQALFALNSRFIQAQAKHLAATVRDAKAATETERIAALYRRAFSRLPTEQEVAISRQYIASQPVDAQPSGWEKLAHVLLAANEFVFLD